MIRTSKEACVRSGLLFGHVTLTLASVSALHSPPVKFRSVLWKAEQAEVPALAAGSSPVFCLDHELPYPFMNCFYLITLIFAIRSFGSCYKLKCVSPNSYVKVPALHVTVFGDRNFMEVTELNEIAGWDPNLVSL